MGGEGACQAMLLRRAGRLQRLSSSPQPQGSSPPHLCCGCHGLPILGPRHVLGPTTANSRSNTPDCAVCGDAGTVALDVAPASKRDCNSKLDSPRLLSRIMLLSQGWQRCSTTDSTQEWRMKYTEYRWCGRGHSDGGALPCTTAPPDHSPGQDSASRAGSPWFARQAPAPPVPSPPGHTCHDTHPTPFKALACTAAASHDRPKYACR